MTSTHRVRARRRGHVVAAALATAAALVAAGCGGGDVGSGDGRLEVVATTTHLGDFARRVGGDRVDVHQILSPNTDPHDYEPRPSDVRQTAEADLVLVSGDDLDPWMGDVVEQSGGSPEVVDVSADLPRRPPGERSGDERSEYDPHWWFDPRNAGSAVGTIVAAMSAADPGQAAGYRAAGQAYLAIVRRMDAGIQRCFAQVPPAERTLVTDHDAFGYLARRYDLRVIGAVIPAQTTQAQASAGEVAELVATIRRTGVRAVFPERSVSARLAEAVARQTGVRSDLTLYGDTLGPEDSDGATYVAMMLHNADALVRGFSGGEAGCRVAGVS